MKKLSLTIALMFLFFGCTKQVPENPIRFSNFRGTYLGQTPPGTKAEIFGPQFISTGMNERDAAFSPDLNEFYFSVYENGRGTIVVVKMVNGKWTNPRVVTFSGVYSDIEPFVSSNGNKIFFSSNRPIEGDEPKDFDIWITEKNEDGEWTKPINLGAPVNSDENEFYPSLTDDGDLYLTVGGDRAMGREDIFVSKFIDGKYQPLENLGDKVNSEKDEFNSFISQDGSYLIYTTTGFGEGFGGGDLWVNFKLGDGTWSGPKNLGEGVNTNRLEYCPSITPDGNYIFFTSNRVKDRIYREKISYDQLTEDHENPFNGTGDIYWVSSEAIQKLK